MMWIDDDWLIIQEEYYVNKSSIFDLFSKLFSFISGLFFKPVNRLLGLDIHKKKDLANKLKNRNNRRLFNSLMQLKKELKKAKKNKDKSRQVKLYKLIVYKYIRLMILYLNRLNMKKFNEDQYLLKKMQNKKFEKNNFALDYHQDIKFHKSFHKFTSTNDIAEDKSTDYYDLKQKIINKLSFYCRLYLSIKLDDDLDLIEKKKKLLKKASQEYRDNFKKENKNKFINYLLFFARLLDLRFYYNFILNRKKILHDDLKQSKKNGMKNIDNNILYFFPIYVVLEREIKNKKIAKKLKDIFKKMKKNNFDYSFLSVNEIILLKWLINKLKCNYELRFNTNFSFRDYDTVNFNDFNTFNASDNVINRSEFNYYCSIKQKIS